MVDGDLWNINLIYVGRYLSPHNTAGYNSIPDRATIYVESELPINLNSHLKRFTIVENSDRPIVLHYELDKFHSIDALKRMWAHELRINPNGVEFYNNHIKLNDWPTLLTAGVKNGCRATIIGIIPRKKVPHRA